MKVPARLYSFPEALGDESTSQLRVVGQIVPCGRRVCVSLLAVGQESPLAPRDCPAPWL